MEKQNDLLKIQSYIKKHGLTKTVNDLNLILKDYENKILLKYDFISSAENFSNEEVKEARGLILEKNSWNVLSLAFKKFFNYGESNAAKIDLNSAIVELKEDGSLIQCYYDWDDIS